MDWRLLVGLALIVGVTRFYLPHLSEKKENEYQATLENCIQQRHASPELYILDWHKSSAGENTDAVIRKIRIESITSELDMSKDAFHFLSIDEQTRLLSLWAKKEEDVSRDINWIKKQLGIDEKKTEENKPDLNTLQQASNEKLSTDEKIRLWEDYKFYKSHILKIESTIGLRNEFIEMYKQKIISANDWNVLSLAERKRHCENLSKDELKTNFDNDDFLNPYDEHIKRQIIDGLIVNEAEIDKETLRVFKLYEDLARRNAKGDVVITEPEHGNIK